MELISTFNQDDQEELLEETFLDDNLFLIDSSNPWYGNVLIYLQTMQFPPNLSLKERRFL